MKLEAPPKPPLEALQRLIESSDVSLRHRQAATRLLHRLSSNLRIVVLGPVAEANRFLHDGLIAAGFGQTPGIRFECIHAAPADVKFDQIDMALWASFVFDAQEAALWVQVPDRLKDHSFLAALLPAGAPETTTLRSIEARAGAEFDAVLPIQMNGDLGGMKALAKRLETRVSEGRLADADAAALLLETCKAQIDETAPIVTMPAPAPAPAPAPTLQATPAPPPPPIQPAADLTFAQEADARLQAHATHITAATEDVVLQTCAEVIQDLADLIERHSHDPALADLQEDIFQANDDIVLMSLEETTRSATDAVTTLLQLRKELQLCCAS